MSAPPSTTPPSAGARPLDGLRVLELGQLVAGAFAGTLLGYFGAEVIKVEPPGEGDAIRSWRVIDDGTSLWWRTLGRNKKSVAIDLREPAGQDLVRRLAACSGVLIENFRPGTLERWGLGPDLLRSENPGLVVARVSGYGQTGPYAPRPGYASVCEGVGGLRYVNGFPGEAPVRTNLSLGDSLAGLHAALGILLALRARDRSGAGQVVDVAITEAVFNMLEATVPEYDRCGVVREPSGTTISGVVPTNTYRAADGRFVIVGATGDAIFRRMMAAAGRADLAADPRFATNAGRVAHQAELDAAIAAWTATLPAAEVVDRLAAAAVPAGLVYSVADMFGDPHFAARGLFEEVEVGGRPLKLPAMAPRLAATPGLTEWAGPAVGEHTREVLGGLLGLDGAALDQLAERGVIGQAET